MLMIGTTELAMRLYDTWRRRQSEWLRGRGRPEPARWEDLSTIEQSVWRDVVETAGRALADALSSSEDPDGRTKQCPK